LAFRTRVEAESSKRVHEGEPTIQAPNSLCALVHTRQACHFPNCRILLIVESLHPPDRFGIAPHQQSIAREKARSGSTLSEGRILVVNSPDRRCRATAAPSGVPGMRQPAAGLREHIIGNRMHSLSVLFWVVVTLACIAVWWIWIRGGRR
jgi:hypothetical protein